MSTSLSIDEPFRLNPDAHTLFEIEIPSGTKGAYLGDNSAVKGQKEFLLARNTKLDITDVKVEEITYVDDYGAEEKVRILKVKARVRTSSNKVGQIEKVGYNEVVKELEAEEAKKLK